MRDPEAVAGFAVYAGAYLVGWAALVFLGPQIPAGSLVASSLVTLAAYAAVMVAALFLINRALRVAECELQKRDRSLWDVYEWAREHVLRK